MDFPSEQENDPRALNGYTIETVEKIFQYLIHYNQEHLDKQFQNQLQTCLICTDVLPGMECIRLRRCGHFYCRSCLNNYVQMTLNNGQFGEKLHCPENPCQQPLLPTEIKQILQNDHLYERYERLTLQHILALMKDIVWCPRCQSAVMIDNTDEDFTICYQCREIFHSQTICQKDYLIEQLKIQQEKERQRIQKQKNEAFAQLGKAEEENKSVAERQIVIKLSEENALLEEILNAERIESLNTQSCPQCHVRIEKNGSCSHMHCSQCNYYFTWQTIPKLPSSTTVSPLGNLEEIESVKEELNRTTVNIVKISEQEIKKLNSNQIEGVDETKQDLKILIDNRSSIGSAIIKRVKSCPNKVCEKPNVKIDQDNWMICNGCMKQYCFLCRCRRRN